MARVIRIKARVFRVSGGEGCEMAKFGFSTKIPLLNYGKVPKSAKGPLKRILKGAQEVTKMNQKAERALN